MKAGICLLVVAGCATIVHGTHDDVLLTSSPPHQRLTTNFGHAGETPLAVMVESDENLVVTFASGQTFILKPGICWWGLGNSLWGVFGWGGVAMTAVTSVVDLATGAAEQHDSRYHFDLATGTVNSKAPPDPESPAAGEQARFPQRTPHPQEEP